MGKTTGITWTDATWNVVTGCTKVSEACEYCYAERYSKRHIGDFKNGRKFTEIKCHTERLQDPIHWKKPKKIFVCSMGDLFHEDVPDEFIEEVFAVMAICDKHTFQILTKRPKRMLSWMRSKWRSAFIEGKAQKLYYDLTHIYCSSWLAVHLPLPNVWIGVTAENQKRIRERIPLLIKTPATIRFVSVEPMLEEINLYAFIGPWGQKGQLQAPPMLDWIIAGGENGPRILYQQWIRSLRDQCQAADVPFHFKQWGSHCNLKQLPLNTFCQWRENNFIGNNTDFENEYFRVGSKAAGRLLDQKIWDEFPSVK